MSDLWLYLRLAFALAVVLAPGWAIARALGLRGASAVLALALASLAAALGVTFLLGLSAPWALGAHLAVGVAALALPRRAAACSWPGWGAAALAGLVLGAMLWFVAGEVGGDGLFHLARARKLLELDDLSLHAVVEFADGGLHPGYAFPLWHGLLALVALVAGADPTDVVLHLPSLLAPLAFVVWYEAGFALFRRRSAALAVTGAAVALAALSPPYGGAYTALALPATASRQLLVPAALALAFLAVRTPTRPLLAAAAAASLALAVTHVTYALFLCVPFAGFLALRFLWTRAELREHALALGALAVPAVLVSLALLPLAGSTASVGPGEAERERAIAQYAGQLDVRSPDSFSLAPEVFGRAGPVAVAALLLLPLVGLAARRRFAAYVVGGALAVFLVTLVPFLFTPFSDVVSLSQARRLAGFLPFPFAFAGGLGVAAALLGPLVAPLALAAGIVLQLLVPGDFDYVLDDGGPAWVTWVSVAGAVAALVVGFRRLSVFAAPGLAAALFLAPVAVGALADWRTSPARPPSPLSDGLVQALRQQVPAGDTVYADPEASYRIGAFAPVYVCVNPPGHVADTERNRPYERRDEARRFLATGDLGIPRACGARWLVVDTSRFDLDVGRPVAYRDGRWVLYRLSP